MFVDFDKSVTDVSTGRIILNTEIQKFRSFEKFMNTTFFSNMPVPYLSYVNML